MHWIFVVKKSAWLIFRQTVNSQDKIFVICCTPQRLFESSVPVYLDNLESRNHSEQKHLEMGQSATRPYCGPLTTVEKTIWCRSDEAASRVQCGPLPQGFETRQAAILVQHMHSTKVTSVCNYNTRICCCWQGAWRKEHVFWLCFCAHFARHKSRVLRRVHKTESLATTSSSLRICFLNSAALPFVPLADFSWPDLCLCRWSQTGQSVRSEIPHVVLNCNVHHDSTPVQWVFTFVSGGKNIKFLPWTMYEKYRQQFWTMLTAQKLSLFQDFFTVQIPVRNTFVGALCKHGVVPLYFFSPFLHQLRWAPDQIRLRSIRASKVSASSELKTRNNNAFCCLLQVRLGVTCNRKIRSSPHQAVLERNLNLKHSWRVSESDACARSFHNGGKDKIRRACVDLYVQSARAVCMTFLCLVCVEVWSSNSSYVRWRICRCVRMSFFRHPSVPTVWLTLDKSQSPDLGQQLPNENNLYNREHRYNVQPTWNPLFHLCLERRAVTGSGRSLTFHTKYHKLNWRNSLLMNQNISQDAAQGFSTRVTLANCSEETKNKSNTSTGHTGNLPLRNSHGDCLSSLWFTTESPRGATQMSSCPKRPKCPNRPCWENNRHLRWRSVSENRDCVFLLIGTFWGECFAFIVFVTK